MIRKWIIPILLLNGLLSCKDPGLYMEYRNFQEYWPASEKAVFAFDAPADRPVNLMIYIRNNKQYPFSNLFLIARMHAGDSLLVCDTLEYAMANPKGEWLGSGFLEVKESQLWWKENYRLPAVSQLKVELEHALRFNGSEKGMEDLEGIVGVGLAIMETGKNE